MISDDSDLGQRLRTAAAVADRSERTLRIAVAIEEALRQAGDQPVLVGGAAVEIYTRSLYTTADFDFVAAGGRKVAAALRDLGFERRGRVWVDSEHEVVVELPSATLAPAESVSMRVGSSTLEIIRVEDLVVDRLAAWKHWGWHPDGVAAGLLLSIHGEDMDVERLQARADAEDVTDALAALRTLLAEGTPLTEDRLSAVHRTLDER